MTYNEEAVAVMDVYIDIPSASITFMALVSEYTICHLHYIYTIITRHTFVTSTLYIPTMIDREFHLGMTPVWPQGGDLALFAGVYVCVCSMYPVTFVNFTGWPLANVSGQ